MVAKRVSQLDTDEENQKEAEVVEAKRAPADHQAARVMENQIVVTGFYLVIAGVEMNVLSNTFPA